jgi:Ni,Fe-hydrogenase III large subunit
MSLLKKLDAAGLFVARTTLENPITVSLAVKVPGAAATVKEQAQLTVELHLSAGPLRLRNVQWLITEKVMDEVLLGRPLLRALGLDAPTHLDVVRHNYQDLDSSKIATAHTGGRLSRLLICRDADACSSVSRVHKIPGSIFT